MRPVPLNGAAEHAACPLSGATEQAEKRRSRRKSGEEVHYYCKQRCSRERCTIIVRVVVLMKLPTSLCPLHLAVIPKLDPRHQTVNWHEVIEITFWSWYLSLAGISVLPASQHGYICMIYWYICMIYMIYA